MARSYLAILKEKRVPSLNEKKGKKAPFDEKEAEFFRRRVRASKAEKKTLALFSPQSLSLSHPVRISRPPSSSLLLSFSSRSGVFSFFLL